MEYKPLSLENVPFIRAKTERTSRLALIPIVAMRTQEINLIIQRWGNKPVSPDTYVFSILWKGIIPEHELALARQETRTMNFYIKRVAADMGIEQSLTTHIPRNTFSTVLKPSGAPPEFISALLGQCKLKKTEFYLDSFEDDIKRQYSRLPSSGGVNDLYLRVQK